MSDILQIKAPIVFGTSNTCWRQGVPVCVCVCVCVCVATLTEHDVQYLNLMKTAVAFPWKVKHWACGLSNTALCL